MRIKVYISVVFCMMLLFIVGCSSVQTTPSNGLVFNLENSTYQEGNTPGITLPSGEVHYVFSGVTNANRVDILVIGPYGQSEKRLFLDSQGNFQGDVVIGRINQSERERFTRSGNIEYGQYVAYHQLTVEFKIYRNGNVQTATVNQGKLIYQ